MTCHFPSHRLFQGVVAAVLAAGWLTGSRLCAAEEAWVPVGIGGGGAFFYPASSPHDPKLMFVSSDMGGFYRSEDGGRSWRMLDWRSIRRSRAPAFHPRDPNVVCAVSWDGGELRVSRDRGMTWDAVSGGGAWSDDRLTCLAFDAGAPERLLLAGERRLYLSGDGGERWSPVSNAPGGMLGLHVDQTSPPERRTCFGASPQGVHRSEDGGQTWKDSSQGLPWREIRSFAGVSDSRRKVVVLYCTIPSRAIRGVFAGGVYRSLDRGMTWRPVGGAGLNRKLGRQDEYGEGDLDQYEWLGAPESPVNIVYVTNRGTGYHPPYHYTVFRSEDFGETWESRFFNDPRFKENNTEVGWLFFDHSRGYGGTAFGFSVNARSPDVLMYANAGEVFTTTDGGRRWRQAYSRCADGTGKKGKRWASIGLEDTSCWRVAFDPADPERRYICYTDIGLAKSEDGGRAWRSATAGMPWQNTVYDLAFDPRDSRTLYAACSDQHDIPHWMSAQGPRAPGGICVSRDGGASWKASSQGLPSAPATAVVVGAFPAGARPALFAGVYGHGVYRSDDGAATWASKSEGLDPAGNRQVCSIRRRQDGALLCVVAARRAGGEGEAPLSGGVFLSTDRGERWKKISPPEMFRPVDVACHPEKPDILYVAAMDGMGHDGGVYKTVDGGGQWQRLSIPFDRRICAYQEGFSVALNPRRPEIVYYLTITHGMFISFDAGASWRAAAAGASPPFLSCQRIQWDPLDGKTVYVSTFGGGVWRGPDPAGEPVAR